LLSPSVSKAGPQKYFRELPWQYLLQAGCTSSRQTNTIDVLKGTLAAFHWKTNTNVLWIRNCEL